jgi:hypothetical protein
LRRYTSALELLSAEGAVVSRLPAEEKAKWISGLPEYGREWVARQESRGLPAREMLVMLMDGLRAAGASPQRDWDRYD